MEGCGIPFLRVIRRRPLAGHAVIELALIGPWLFLLFAVVLNFGMFMYTGISVANAARAAALEAGRSSVSALDQALACTIVREELRYLPGITVSLPCNAAPLVVVMGNAGSAITAIDDNTKAGARVRVTYTNPPLFALPGMNSQFTISRAAEVRVFQ